MLAKARPTRTLLFGWAEEMPKLQDPQSAAKAQAQPR